MNALHGSCFYLFLAGLGTGIAFMTVLLLLADKAAAREARRHLPLTSDTPRRRRFRDALSVETTTMIQRQLTPGPGTYPCACGRMPHLIETRGNPDPKRLADKPTTAYHLECPPCGITTARDPHQLVPQAQWNAGITQPIDVTRLSA